VTRARLRGAARAVDRRQAYLLITPAALVLAAVAAYPLLASVWLSLHHSILVFHDQRYVGLGNFRSLAHDARFWSALDHTACFTAIAVALELLLALPVAQLLHEARRGRGALRAAVLIPWALPTAVSAKLWVWLLMPGLGLFHRIWPGHQMNWLGTPVGALAAAILVDVWKTTPFVALLVLAGLQTIPEDLYRAARVDGASGWRMFRSITLPLLRPVLLLALLFRSLDAFRVFDSIYVLTEGGPANSTETLSIYAYKTLMRSGDFGYGATLSVVTFLCVALLGGGSAWAVARETERSR